MPEISKAMNRDVRRFKQQKQVFDGDFANDVEESAESITETGAGVEVSHDLGDMYRMTRLANALTHDQNVYLRGEKRKH